MSTKEDIKELGYVFGMMLLIGAVLIGIGYGCFKVGELAINTIDDKNMGELKNSKETTYYKVVWGDKNNLEGMISKYKKGDQTISITLDFQVFDQPDKRVKHVIKLYTNKEKLFTLSDTDLTAYRNVGIFSADAVKVISVGETLNEESLMLEVTKIPEYHRPQLYAVIKGFIWDGQRVYELMPVGEDSNGTFSNPYVYRFTPEFFIDLQYDVIYIEGQGYIINDVNDSLRLVPFESERQLWADSDFTK
jgi:hypothetical protein